MNTITQNEFRKLTNRGFAKIKQFISSGLITPEYRDGKPYFSHDDVELIKTNPRKDSKDEVIASLQADIAILNEFVLKMTKHKTRNDSQMEDLRRRLAEVEWNQLETPTQETVAPTHKQVTIVTKPKSENTIESITQKPIEEMSSDDLKVAQLVMSQLGKNKGLREAEAEKERKQQERAEIAEQKKHDKEQERLEKYKNSPDGRSKLEDIYRKNLVKFHGARYIEMCDKYVPTVEDFELTKYAQDVSVAGTFEAGDMKFYDKAEYRFIHMLEAVDFVKFAIVEHGGELLNKEGKGKLKELKKYIETLSPYNHEWNAAIYADEIIQRKVQPTVALNGERLEPTDAELYKAMLLEESKAALETTQPAPTNVIEGKFTEVFDLDVSPEFNINDFPDIDVATLTETPTNIAPQYEDNARTNGLNDPEKYEAYISSLPNLREHLSEPDIALLIKNGVSVSDDGVVISNGHRFNLDETMNLLSVLKDED